MKLNKIQFGKLKLQWDIRKYAAGVLHGDEAIGEILDRHEDDNALASLRMLLTKGYDVQVKEDLQSSKDDDSESKYKKLYDEALTSQKIEYDAFGNARKWTEREVIEEKLRELEQLGRKLLDEEKYEEMQEALEIYEKLKKELDRL